MERLEKLAWLEETCSEGFISNILITEMVRWMGEEDFNEFYEHLCSHWDIKTPEELDKEITL